MKDNILTTAIYARWRTKKETPFLVVEVIQLMFPINWKEFKSDLLEELQRLLDQNKIEICKGEDFDLLNDLEQIKIKIIGKT